MTSPVIDPSPRLFSLPLFPLRSQATDGPPDRGRPGRYTRRFSCLALLAAHPFSHVCVSMCPLARPGPNQQGGGEATARFLPPVNSGVSVAGAHPTRAWAPFLWTAMWFVRPQSMTSRFWASAAALLLPSPTSYTFRCPATQRLNQHAFLPQRGRKHKKARRGSGSFPGRVGGKEEVEERRRRRWWWAYQGG